MAGDKTCFLVFDRGLPKHPPSSFEKEHRNTVLDRRWPKYDHLLTKTGTETHSLAKDVPSNPIFERKSAQNTVFDRRWPKYLHLRTKIDHGTPSSAEDGISNLIFVRKRTQNVCLLQKMSQALPSSYEDAPCSWNRVFDRKWPKHEHLRAKMYPGTTFLTGYGRSTFIFVRR